MKTLRERMNNKKGFTLAELLIVVAIIAIMIAISVPIFTSQLNKAKNATDEANERAAKSAAVAMYLSEDSHPTVFYYDAKNGNAVKEETTDTIPAVIKEPYGKGSDKAGTSHVGKVIKVTITATATTSTDTATIEWVEKSGS